MSVNTYNSTTGVLTRVAGNGGGSFIYPHIYITAETGSTVTITDGTATITAIETSEGLFEAEVIDLKTYTITATLNGSTLTQTLDVDTVKKYSVDFESSVSVTLTIYSAKEDTISYTDIDGDTQIITFDTDATSKQVSIEIEASGSSITFTSGVAKDPSDLTADYSKTVTITSNTTEVYLMPDNALYWWGYEDSNLEDCLTANGWSVNTYTMSAPTHNTNDITAVTTSNALKGVGTKNPVSMSKATFIATGTTYVSPAYTVQGITSNKNINSLTPYVYGDSTTIKKYEISQSGTYNIAFYASTGRAGKLHAMFYE